MPVLLNMNVKNLAPKIIMSQFKKLYAVVPLILIMLSIPIYAANRIYNDTKYDFAIEFPEDLSASINFFGTPFIIYLEKKSFLNSTPPNIAITVLKSPPPDKTRGDIADMYDQYGGAVSWKGEQAINGVKFINIEQTQEKTLPLSVVDLKLYHLITIRNGLIYTITYNATEGDYSEFLGAAKNIIQSFKFIK